MSVLTNFQTITGMRSTKQTFVVTTKLRKNVRMKLSNPRKLFGELRPPPSLFSLIFMGEDFHPPPFCLLVDRENLAEYTCYERKRKKNFHFN